MNNLKIIFLFFWNVHDLLNFAGVGVGGGYDILLKFLISLKIFQYFFIQWIVIFIFYENIFM